MQTKTALSTRGLHWKNIILQILNRFNSSIDASMIIIFLVLFTFYKWFYKETRAHDQSRLDDHVFVILFREISKQTTLIFKLAMLNRSYIKNRMLLPK